MHHSHYLIVPGLVIILCSCGAEMGGGATGYSDSGGPSSPWTKENAYSPTGTVLVPTGSGGYDVVDEVCGGDLESPDYPERFATPMFRDVAVSGDRAWLVDGSHLWTMDVSVPHQPVRIGLDRLPGHPVAVHLGPARLWIATVDQGLIGIALDGDLDVDMNDIVELFTPSEGASNRVMDVDGANRILYVALGNDALGLVVLDGAGGIVTTRKLGAEGFANAVELTEGYISMSSCSHVRVYQIPTPGSFQQLDEWTHAHKVAANFKMPFGVAKGAIVAGKELYVSGGTALLAFRLNDEPGGSSDPDYLGHHTDNEPGFYVNEAVVSQGFIYIAAGDQSVRVLDIRNLTLKSGIPIAEAPDKPELTEPEQAELQESVEFIEPVQIVIKDPISLELAGSVLFVLGNFRYLGERTIEVFDVSVPAWLNPVGTYIQPNLGVGLSAFGPDLLIHGSDGWHRMVDPSGESGGAFAYEPGLLATRSRTDGLYLISRDGPVVRATRDGSGVQLKPVIPEGNLIRGLAFNGDRGFASEEVRNGILVFGEETGGLIGAVAPSDRFLGDAALHATQDRLYAYDRFGGNLETFDLTQGPMPRSMDRIALNQCEAYDIADFYSGAVNARTRFIDHGGELYLLCPRDSDGGAGIIRILLDEDGLPYKLMRTELPKQVYTSIAFQGKRVLTTSFDNNHYRSIVMANDLGTGEILKMREYSGHVNAVQTLPGSDHVFTVDGDRGLLILDADLEPLASIPVEGL